MAKKGDWVRIHSIILKPGERAPQVPEDTAIVPLEMWVKGEILQDADIGDIVCVRTPAGREISGTLLAGGLDYNHSFGDFVPELHQIGPMLRRMLKEGQNA